MIDTIWKYIGKAVYWFVHGEWPSLYCEWCDKEIHNHNELDGKCVVRLCDCTTKVAP